MQFFISIERFFLYCGDIATSFALNKENTSTVIQ